MTDSVVLVGGCGFIGHHLALKWNKPVTIIDSLMVNNYYALTDGNPLHLSMLEERFRLLEEARIPLLRMDARDYNIMSPALKALRPTTIVHLAAIAHLDRANKDPYSTWDHSLRTLENSLDIAHNIGVKRFVYFSSSTVYGDFLTKSVHENTPLKPRGIYGAMKLAGEAMVTAYGETYGMETVIVRPSGLYGPRCVSGRVVQKFIENALEGRPLKLKGSETVDFTYVDDLVAGVIAAAESDKTPGKIYNLTAGQAHTIQELAVIVKEHFPKAIIIQEAEDRERPHRGTLEIYNAARDFGYSPQYPLREGVAAYIESYKRLHNVERKTA